MRSLRGIGVVVAVALAIGCMDRDLAPIEPVTQTGIDVRIEQVGAAKVDIVVLVDNSGSMGEEQGELTRRFRELIEQLVDPPDADGNTVPDSVPVADLNIGVVSSDMGTMGLPVTTCSNPAYGDDGCFHNQPSPLVSPCEASYGPFLSRNDDNAATYPAVNMANDFACIATLGTRGCGFEQPLKAMRSAIVDKTAPGGCNAGFLRPDSIIALMFVTDENDCSVSSGHPEMFDEGRDDLGHLNVRCFLHPEFIDTVPQYEAAFASLRGGDKSKIVMAFIVGVPPNAPACNGTGDRLAGCLAVPEMEEVVNAAGNGLVPSCNAPPMGVAYPPVRFVQLAMSWGDNAIVQSICKDDWTDAIDAITSLLQGKLPSVCFARELEFVTEDPNDEATTGIPDRDCYADCRVIETYNDARACPEDPNCPSSWCPTASVDDPNPPPCVDPGDPSHTCIPYKRDLGICQKPDCAGRRQCLIRQAQRTWEGTRCSAPASGQEGWFYMPTGVLRNEPGCSDPPCIDPACPQLQLTIGETPIIEDNSDADLRCLAFLCPGDRQCGSSEQPTAACCAPGQLGSLGDGRNLGSCQPAHCDPGLSPRSVGCSTTEYVSGYCE